MTKAAKPQTAPKEPIRVQLAFTTEAIDMLLEALAHLPIGRALGLFESIKKEAMEQIAKQKEEPANG